MATVDTTLSNYGSTYDAWYDAETIECPECRGTGMDRDELYDCELCFGECVIVIENPETIAHAGNIIIGVGVDSPPQP